MAIATGSFSFSIREYAEGMRRVDYDKCWPFPEERAGRSLPPIPVRRFRWWVDELRALRSDGRRTGDLVDPADEAASVDVVAGGQDEQIHPRSVHVVTAGDGEASAGEKRATKTPSRAKQRTPRKRSIRELFAVAPAIHGEGIERGDEPTAAKSSLRVADGGDLEELMITSTRGKEGEKTVRDKIGAKEKLMVSSKMMKKKNILKVEICAAKKEKALLLKRPPLDGFCKLLEVYELFRRMVKKLVHNRLKPATFRTIVQRHVFKLFGTSNMELKNLEEEKLLPLHAKFKKLNVVALKKKKKKDENMMGDELVDHACESSKHVNFSRTDLAVLHDLICFPLLLPHLQSLFKLVSDVLVEIDREGSNERSSATEGPKLSLNDTGFVIRNLVTDKNDFQKQLSDSCGHVTATLSSCKKRTSLAKFDLNHPMQEHIDLNKTVSDELTMPSSPRYLDGRRAPGPRNNVDFYPDQIINEEQMFSPETDHVNISCISNGASVSASNATSALISTRNQDKHQQMHDSDQRGMGLSERQTHFVEPVKHVSNGFLGFYGPPKQLVTSTCSSFQSKAVVDPTPKMGLMLRDMCTVKDFVGLPLNSQGEFIQLHPGNRYGFVEADNIANTGLDSLQYLPSSSHILPQSSHLTTKGKFPFASFCHEEDQHCFSTHHHPAKFKISDLDSAELQGQEKLKFHPHNNGAQVNSSDGREQEFFCCGCKDYIATECFNKMKFCSGRDMEVGIQPEIQPTMRLMGTDFTIGRYSKKHKGCNGVKIWTGKEISASYHPTRVHNRAMSNRWQVEECISQGDSGDPGDVLFEFSSCLCAAADAVKSCHMHLGSRSNWMLEDRNSLSRPHGYHIDHSQGSVPCQSFLKKASHSLVHCIPETGFEDIGRQKASQASYPQKFCQHTLLSSAQYRHHRSASYSIQSASPPYHTNQVPIPTSKGLHLQEMPHWLQNTTSQYSPFMSCHPIQAYQACTVPQDIGFPRASPYRTPVISYLSGSSSVSQAYGSYPPASASALRKNNFSLASSTYGYNVKPRDGSGINYDACHENLHYSKRCRKRPAFEDIKIMETVKRPNRKLSVEREQLHGKQKVDMRESEINSYACTKKDIRLPVVALSKNSVVVSGEKLPLKSSHMRSGPIKLSAGAKHILKPSRSSDQEYSSPIYVSVPFTQGTSTTEGFVTLEETAEATKV